MSMQKIVRQHHVTLALLGSALLVTAPGSALAQGAKTKVTVMTWEGTSTNQSIIDAMAAFERANPTIDVELVNVPAGGYDQARNGLIQAKRLPDLFWVGNDQALEYGQQGILYDWSKYAASKTSGLNLANFAPGTVDSYRVDGKLYGLPSLVNNYGYFYNIDLFRAAGVPLPKPGWTYKQFFDAAAKLTVKTGGRTTRYGVYAPHNDIFTLSQYSVSAGGAPFANRMLNTTRVAVSPQMVEGARLWTNAIQSGTVTPRNYPGDGLTELFTSGKVPMLGGGQWLAAGFLEQKPGFNWGFAPMPIVSKRVHILDAVGIASPSYIKNPDAVWKVLTFLNTRAWEKVLVDAPVAPSAYLPASKPYFDKLKAAGAGSVTDSLNNMLSAPSKVGVRFLAPAWAGKGYDAINATYNTILSGRLDARTGLDKIARDVNTVIQRGR